MDLVGWEGLLSNAALQAVLTKLEDGAPILETAIAIQQIPAPTFAEQQRAAFIRDAFVRLGLADVHIDALGNVYGRCVGRDHSHPATMISAHLDTVFPAETDLTVRHDRARVYGPGIGDNSTGVAGLFHVAQALQAAPELHRGDLWFVANVGEEGLGDLCGMRAAVAALRDRIANVVVIEGCDFGTLHHQAIGVKRYRIRATAAGGHSWGNYGAPSAIHTLVRLAADLSRISPPQQPRTTLNIGTISGGTSVNTIAQSAELLLDMRSVSPQSLAELVERVDYLIERTRRSPNEAALEVVVVGDRPSGSISREHPLVRAAAAAFQHVGANLTYQQSSTDANIPLSLGIPTVCVGLTDGGNAHRTDEYILPARLARGVQALLLLTVAANQIAL